MVVMREPVPAVVIAATVDPRGAEAAIMKGAATEMGAASNVTAAKMHATAVTTTAAKVHAAATVATSAKVTAATMTATAAMPAPHRRDHAVRYLLRHTDGAGVDQ